MSANEWLSRWINRASDPMGPRIQGMSDGEVTSWGRDEYVEGNMDGLMYDAREDGVTLTDDDLMTAREWFAREWTECGGE